MYFEFKMPMDTHVHVYAAFTIMNIGPKLLRTERTHMDTYMYIDIGTDVKVHYVYYYLPVACI